MGEAFGHLPGKSSVEFEGRSNLSREFQIVLDYRNRYITPGRPQPVGYTAPFQDMQRSRPHASRAVTRIVGNGKDMDRHDGGWPRLLCVN